MNLRPGLRAVFSVFLTLWVGLTVAHADADYDNALATAPQGIALDQIFTPGETTNNKAQVVDTTNAQTVGTQAVMVTNAKNQFGTIWSTDDNAFELNQDESVSMWMYFGNKGADAADGMAFVLQNDPRGVAATPSFGSKISGETLGVWAVDTNTKQTDPAALAKLAIQNSWALEFDTHLNKSNTYSKAGGADSFDVGLTGPHLAAAYPGEGSSYQLVKTTSGIIITQTAYYATLNHQGVIAGGNDLLSNGSWHHVTMDWDAQAHKMTYIFDDKDPATGNEQTGTSQTVTVDPAVVDPEQTGKIRWGFTGATGSSYANNLVIFESVPGLVETDATATLTDLNTGQVVKDGASIRGTHEVQLDYDLTYEGGKQAWKDVTAKLKLPHNLEFEKIKVTYANGDSQTVDATAISDDQLTFKLDTALSTTNQTAKIRLTGTVTDQKQASDVAAKTSTFTAVNGVTTADTVRFTIEPKLDIDLLLTSASTVTLAAGETTTIKGQVFVPEGITITNDDLTVHPTINGKTMPVEQIKDPDDNLSGKVRYTPAATDLPAGKNTVVLYVEDNYGNRSNTITVTVNVTGGLTFDQVATNSSFKATTLTGSSQRVARTNDWSVRVLDTRAAGARWSLQAAVGDFTTSDGHKLAGGLTYSDGDSSIKLTSTPTTIHQGTSSTNQDVTDVVDDWTDETGIQLTVDGDALSGDYSGQIDWTLTDAPA
ncbi:lectin-like domain-containing protein [Levilactobacillus zymae]|uniref:lectin-like domain-containing protein n=1 Tax=Levilactobacillus zymae TaxID=267363 RepID=UPI0028BA7A3B|nr:WxL domain-containing protein [Levilactobacillus zymae]MDT6980262.1 WxL domain-containing protein [Levilactobacillus zymae]